MFDIYCFFHSSCYDPFHIAICFFVVIFSLLAVGGLISFLCWCAGCAIHTGLCNSLSHDNSKKIRDLERRISELESDRKEVKHKSLLR